MIRHRWMTALVLFLAACPARKPPASSVCRACFWEYQDRSLKKELISVYRARRFDDPLLEAERKLLVAAVKEGAQGICRARRGFEIADDPARALYAAEVLAFTASSCGADPAAALRVASTRAHVAGDDFKAGVYADLAEGRFAPRFGETVIARKLDVPHDAASFVLGASRIVVPAGAKVGAQVERTVRDWLSYQLAWDGRDRPVSKEALLEWHEGARLRDLLAAAPASVVPLTGTLAVRREGRWLAPDGEGVFRYEVLEDKIQYPTTLVAGEVALIVDTHGISALVAGARREGVALVVGCGDSEGKMQAAFDLARRGVDVWYPCDRFAGDVLGYDAPGVLIGSAPVRREGDHAVIGDVPVRFAMKETIVVQDFAGAGAFRYYDAPARYFRALAERAPLKADYVPVEGPGQSSRVIARAEELHATAIAVRVQTDEDAAPVRAWLGADPSHRAVLFHAAPYPAGYALFGEFPRQTTFGDARPSFER